MTINEYQKLAQRTSNKALSKGEHLLNGAMGLCGESGEVADLVKKAYFQGHLIDRARITEELGDCAWYLAELAAALDVSLETILDRNIAKLEKRYPDGFDAERSFADFASQTEDSFNSAMATEEDAYIRQRAKQEAYYRYAIEHGYTNKLTGKAYTVEDWEKFAASYDAQYQARRIALTDQNAQVMATAFDALIASSDYGDAWKLIKNVYAAYGGLDTAFDEYGNYSDIDWSRFTDATDIAALGDQVYGLYEDLGRFEKILKPYKDSAFGGQMLTMLGMTEGLSNVLYASDRGAGAYGGSIAEDMTAQFGQKIEVTDDGTAAETRTEIEQVFAEPITQTVNVKRSGDGGSGGEKKKGFWSFLGFAEGGRSEEPAIFGEDGPEWAIPEEHSSRTAQLLDAARRGSGFTWKEILERNGGLNANPHSGGSRTLVYSPTIYARDADGVEARLLEDKARLEKWWRERALREEVEVYA